MQNKGNCRNWLAMWDTFCKQDWTLIECMYYYIVSAMRWDLLLDHLCISWKSRWEDIIGRCPTSSLPCLSANAQQEFISLIWHSDRLERQKKHCVIWSWLHNQIELPIGIWNLCFHSIHVLMGCLFFSLWKIRWNLIILTSQILPELSCYSR